jgi:hypothetical protein
MATAEQREAVVQQLQSQCDLEGHDETWLGMVADDIIAAVNSVPAKRCEFPADTRSTVEAEIVAWLRRERELRLRNGSIAAIRMLEEAADAIEAGEHREKR